MVNGLLVLGYFLLSYIAVAPLMKDDKGEIQLDSAVVALTLGVVTSGILLLLALVLSLDEVTTIILPLLLLGLLNSFRHRLQIIPKFPSLRISYLIGFGFLFFIYAGATIVASLKSGYGDYPYVFFDVDTPYRLSTAYELLKGKQSLSNLGYPTGPNHFGGPALAATISLITGVPINKAYFIFGMPLVALGTFCCFTVFTRTLGLSGERRVLSILLLSSTVYFGDLIWKLVSTPIDLTVLQMLGGIVSHHQTEFIKPFGWGWNGSVDITYQTALFILGAWLVFAVRKGQQRIFGYSLIIILAVMSKIDTVIPIAMFGVTQIIFFERKKLTRYSSLFAILAIGLVVVVAFSSSYSHVEYRWEIALGRLFREEFHIGLALLLELLIVVVGCLTYIFCNKGRGGLDFSLLLPGIVTLLWPLVFFNLVELSIWFDNERVTYAPIPHFYTTAYWIIVPCCVSALLVGMPAVESARRWIMTLLFLPFVVAVLLVSTEKLENVVRHQYFPESVGDYVYNRNVGELLRLVPTETTLLVTNDFRHPAGNFDRELMQMILPALFGHQWFAVNYMTYRSTPGRQDIYNRIKMQESVLVGDEDTMLKVAKRYGWTHYLERIEQAPSKRESLWLLGENREYRVYQFPD